MAADIEPASAKGAKAAARLCNFPTGHDTLLPSHMAWLDRAVGSVVRSAPNPWVDLFGYASHLGNPTFNKKLSDQRCAAVMKYVQKLNPKTLFPQEFGYGDSKSTGGKTDNDGYWRAVEVFAYGEKPPGKPSRPPLPGNGQMLLSLWINAFIPRTVAGYTRVIPTGVWMGKTAVPLPGLALLNPGNWSAHTDNGFLTDQRDFNDAPTASVRMQSLAVVDLSKNILVSQNHHSSGTTQVDMVTGAFRGFSIASMSRCRFTQVPSTSSLTSMSPAFPTPVTPLPGNSLVLRLEAAAADPLVSLAADIDYEGNFTIYSTATGLVVDFDGKLDQFPAFEAYADFNGTTRPLFKSPPPPGNTVMDLPGKANRPIRARATFP